MVERLRDVLDNRKQRLGFGTVCLLLLRTQNSIINTARVPIIYETKNKGSYVTLRPNFKIFCQKQNKRNEWPDFFSSCFLCFFKRDPPEI
jgi:hypothetical protein